MTKCKYVVITGGVVSGLGKGIVAASLGTLFSCRELKVEIMKFDPYLNFDAGTMNPDQHGELFVTRDGAETDLDLGHYERFTGNHTSKLHNVTSGQVYQSVISRERRGEYLGHTTQVVPHITNEIKHRVAVLVEATKPDILIIEIGGTVGDMEGLPILEGLRQMKNEVGRDNMIFIHVALVAWLEASKELKTKTVQHSLHGLQACGIRADAVVCRTSHALQDEHIRKISDFGDIDRSAIFESIDVDSVYEVPSRLQSQGMDTWIMKRLAIDAPADLDMSCWADFNHCRDIVKSPIHHGKITIAVIGKYAHEDAYICIDEALKSASWRYGCDIAIIHIDSTDLESQGFELDRICDFDGILVPGGFGPRGIAGKLKAINTARTMDIPFLGICLGLQVAVMEFAQNVIGLDKATSTEFDEIADNAVISLMEDQKSVANLGGTMRLGSYSASVVPHTKAHALYGSDNIEETHRHRYEVTERYVHKLEEYGMVVSARSEKGDLVEIIELPKLLFFMACQFHPEYRSYPLDPHPLFKSFIQASSEWHKAKLAMVSNGVSPFKKQEHAH